MYNIMEFLFGNIILIIIIVTCVIIYNGIKKLKDYKQKIEETFNKVLNNYLDSKIVKTNEIINDILNKYGKEDTVSTEINRLLITIKKGATGDVNDKVNTSNAINKFKLNDQIDLNKYPYLATLKTISTFSEEEMNSLDNGIAIARREYNALALKYNEKASSFPYQSLTKLFGLNEHYVIFDATKSQIYEETYEVLQEEEPEINSLTSLNTKIPQVNKTTETIDLPILKEETFTIKHSDTILKPTNLNSSESINSDDQQNTTNM